LVPQAGWSVVGATGGYAGAPERVHLASRLCLEAPMPEVAVTVLDCTPGMRHDNFCDSAVAMMRYRALFCANAVSNSRGDWYPSAECSRNYGASALNYNLQIKCTVRVPGPACALPSLSAGNHG